MGRTDVWAPLALAEGLFPSTAPPQSGECAPLQQGKVATEDDYYSEPVFRPPPGCTPMRGQSSTNSAQVRTPTRALPCAPGPAFVLHALPLLLPLSARPPSPGCPRAVAKTQSLSKVINAHARVSATAQVSYLFGGHGDAAGPDPSNFDPPPSPGVVRLVEPAESAPGAKRLWRVASLLSAPPTSDDRKRPIHDAEHGLAPAGGAVRSALLL